MKIDYFTKKMDKKYDGILPKKDYLCQNQPNTFRCFDSKMDLKEAGW